MFIILQNKIRVRASLILSYRYDPFTPGAYDTPYVIKIYLSDQEENLILEKYATHEDVMKRLAFLDELLEAN